MVNLDLIELADLARPAEIASAIVEQNPGIPVPIPLEEVATAAGIQQIQYEALDGLEGALVANPEKSVGVILINNRSRSQRQRFTLGHELGHFLIPRHGHKMNCGIADLSTRDQKSLNSTQRIELEANQFSAELLMPTTLFRQYKGFRNDPSMECLIPQAEHFNVSFEACAQRYAALHDDLVAIVFSHKNNIRYSCKGDDFPFWIKPGKGFPVPKDSCTYNTDTSNSNFVISGRCYADTWIDNNRYYETPEEIVEEVYIMENGYVATMLFFDEELIEIE